MIKHVQSPILFLVFNRPEPARKVFDAIRAARPTRLYVAADGPRADRELEPQLCSATRAVVADVDWPCEVATLFQNKNLGCKVAVSQAIDWFFENEQEGIVLEDDCLPNASFFRFCDELLERYRIDDRVGLISGTNYQFGRTFGQSSYYFSRYPHIWGWASWRRTWRHYDREARQWPSFQRSGGLSDALGPGAPDARYWRDVFSRVYAGRIDTWDYQLTLALWTRRMLSIIPQTNLVTNIGFGTDATHTTLATKFANMSTGNMEFPLRHPFTIAGMLDADAHTARQNFGRSLASRAVSRLSSLVSGAIHRMQRV